LLSETFINGCYTLILNKNANIRRDKTLYRDIFEVLSFYKKKERVDIPLSIQNKFDCLVKICEMKLRGKEEMNIIDNVTMSAKFSPLKDYMELKSVEEIIDSDITDHVHQVRLKKKINHLFSNYDELSDMLDSVRNNSYESADDLVVNYEEVIKKLFINLMENNRAINVESCSSLDLNKDDFGPIIQTIKERYANQRKTPTGFSVLDNDVFNGGFEPSRLYIFGGGSGSGKSTILNNFIVNAATMDESLFLDAPVETSTDEIDKVFIYITMENTIDEAFMRTYMPMFDKSTNGVLKDIEGGVDIKKLTLDKLKKNKSTIIMKYFKARTVTAFDLAVVVDDVIAEYGRDKIQGVYIDYLDLLKPDIQYELYRLELAHITLTLKALAVDYGIPFITATQLGRTTYEGVREAQELTMNLISESVKKIEHADAIILQAKDITNDKQVFMRVGKNRSGRAEINIEWNVNFATFKFISGQKVTNSKKVNAANENSLGFDGMSQF